MRYTIVAGLDGGGGWAALSWAAEETALRDARLLVCRVYIEHSTALAASPSTAAVELGA